MVIGVLAFSLRVSRVTERHLKKIDKNFLFSDRVKSYLQKAINRYALVNVFIFGGTKRDKECK